MDSDKHDNGDSNSAASLPRTARLPINRCNLPAVILGSLTFQHHPAPLALDGVHVLHRELFQRLDALDDTSERAQQFIEYMTVSFLLHAPQEMGYEKAGRFDRHKADYLRVLRGWGFDAEGREGAVLKGWVESRFGLMTRFHHGPIDNADADNYHTFQQAYAEGIYNTNALESQLDLLYAFCQYELFRRYPQKQHLTLYRGVNRLEEFELLHREGRQRIVLLNNINSFTVNRERADEFGDHILRTEVPLAKIAFFDALLPGALKGEEEYAVLGGVYTVTLDDV